MGAMSIGIGRAKVLVLSALPAISLDLRSLVGLVLAQHILHVPLGETMPAYIGTDQRGVDMHNLGVAIFAVRQASTVRLKYCEIALRRDQATHACGRGNIFSDVPSTRMRENPVNTYAVSKAAADRLCHTYYLEHGVPVVPARIFNCYGPRETEP